MAWTYKITSSAPWNHLSASGNAKEFYNYFNALGFTLESICGMLGNIEHESFLNPGQGQIGGGGGLGFIQWTPSTDLTNYVSGNWYDGARQCDLINREGTGAVSGRWIKTSQYKYNWTQFSKLRDVEEATRSYLAERERSGVAAITQRLQYANYWYQFLSGEQPEPPTPPTPTTGNAAWLFGAVSNLKARKILL